jgi:hypothetical protein|tara:strand:- start:200 stop:577 length:378 start_codon:yes stop_codon:yes gene_type:complete
LVVVVLSVVQLPAKVRMDHPQFLVLLLQLLEAVVERQEELEKTVDLVVVEVVKDHQFSQLVLEILHQFHLFRDITAEMVIRVQDGTAVVVAVVLVKLVMQQRHLMLVMVAMVFRLLLLDHQVLHQ